MKMTPRELNRQLHGVCVISITPFKEDGAFDAKGYEKNLRFIMDHGLNKSNATIVVGGSTGECGAMNTAERKEVLECALAVCGDALPVIAGCNSTNVRESIELAQHAEAHGAVGVMALSLIITLPKTRSASISFIRRFRKTRAWASCFTTTSRS